MPLVPFIYEHRNLHAEDVAFAKETRDSVIEGILDSHYIRFEEGELRVDKETGYLSHPIYGFAFASKRSGKVISFSIPVTEIGFDPLSAVT